MKPLPYKHFFTINGGKYRWEDVQMFELKRKLLEGKRGYAIIEEEAENASSNQLAYYFGGIIRNECMNSNVFGGMKEKEIHNHLLFEVRGYVRNIVMPDGSRRIAEMIPDFDEIKNSKKEMTKYIEEVIAKLETEYEIYPKPSEHYKASNKFKIPSKQF